MGSVVAWARAGQACWCSVPLLPPAVGFGSLCFLVGLGEPREAQTGVPVLWGLWVRTLVVLAFAPGLSAFSGYTPIAGDLGFPPCSGLGDACRHPPALHPQILGVCHLSGLIWGALVSVTSCGGPEFSGCHCRASVWGVSILLMDNTIAGRRANFLSSR